MSAKEEDGANKKLRRRSKWRSTLCAFLTSMLSALVIPSPVGSEDPKYTTRGLDYDVYKDPIEDSLLSIHAVSNGALGSLCVTRHYRRLEAPVNSSRWESLRVRADLAATVLQELGLDKQDVLEAITRGLVTGDGGSASARVIALTSGAGGELVSAGAAFERRGGAGVGPPVKDATPPIAERIDAEYPWYEEAGSAALRSPKFMPPSPSSSSAAGWWTYPYYSCQTKKWIISYTVPIPTIKGLKGILSLDVDISGLEVNQCEGSHSKYEANEISSFHNTHKCHKETTQCEYRRTKAIGANLRSGWARGSYLCTCKRGYYSTTNPDGFNGSLIEVAYRERETSSVDSWSFAFSCRKCEPGCETCRGPEPCLAHYNWPFRITILSISVWCAIFTVALAAYTRKHRRAKVFRVASPVFLSITLLGCAIMYLEMAAIFPVLDMYSCIATKWTRHLGFCITYTALLMKTWRVSLTYRVKSAHKLKLTDKQLLQWMAPVLLVMLVYLGTWTLSAPPYAEDIEDRHGLKFKQCSYNWWDHSMAIGELFFLLWGIRVCYSVRHAESLYNEARLISYAIYNIAAVNMLMVAFHLMIVPQAGPDIKYALGFIRTQLSTSVTIVLVFGPKVLRVMRGAGDTWDRKARAALPASLSLNGVGLVPDEPPDLYTENEELKEEIQKLAAQIEFMKIVHMELHNRHLKPRPGGYFSTPPALLGVQPCPIAPSPSHRGHSMQGCGEV